MNAYASISDLTARKDLRQVSVLTTDDDTGTLNTNNAQVALDDAASTLDSVFTNRIALPIPAPIPLILTRICCALAFAALYGRRGDVPADIQKEVDFAEDWLNQFRLGQVSVAGSARNGPELTQSDSCDRGSITNGKLFFPSKGPGIPFIDGGP